MSKSRIYVLSALLVTAGLTTFYVAVEQHVDIDFKSGCLRYRTVVGPIVLSQRVEKTPFTEMMGVPCSNSPDWHRVNTKGAFGGHGRFGIAVTKLTEFTNTCKDLEIDTDVRRVLGSEMLKRLSEEEFEKADDLLDDLRRSAPRNEVSVGRPLQE